MNGQIILLTGIPGVGKSTLLRKIVDSIPEDERLGFLTEEIKSVKGERVGFQLVSLNSPIKRLWLARREDIGLTNSTRFGRWFVSIDSMQYFVDNYMSIPEPSQTLILDEIGPMQCLHYGFMKRVEQLLKGTHKGRYKIIDTIKRDDCHIPLVDDFLRKVKKFVGDGVIEVTEDNREKLLAK